MWCLWFARKSRPGTCTSRRHRRRLEETKAIASTMLHAPLPWCSYLIWSSYHFLIIKDALYQGENALVPLPFWNEAYMPGNGIAPWNWITQFCIENFESRSGSRKYFVEYLHLMVASSLHNRAWGECKQSFFINIILIQNFPSTVKTASIFFLANQQYFTPCILWIYIGNLKAPVGVCHNGT